MKSLVFLTGCRLKNKLRELVRRPGKLILTLVFAFVMVMNLFVGNVYYSASRPIEEFFAIIFVFYLLCFLLEAKKGFEHGGTMFSLTDVNFLFVSPLKPASVLFHAMVGRMGASMWMGLAFIYQFSLLRSSYDISVIDMIIAVIGYGAVAFLSQNTGMLIYFFTCGRKEKLKKAKTAFYALFAVFFAAFLSGFDFSSPSFLGAAESLTAFPMKLFPVAGWVFAVAEGALRGQSLQSLIGISACLAFTVLTFAVIATKEHGYYEDVLLTAERRADTKSESSMKSDDEIPEKNHGGIRRGRGASAIFYRHCLENRRSKTSLFSPSSLFYLAMIVVYALALKSELIELFSLSCTVSVLTVLSGKWLKELAMPQVYLIPESAVKKLFYMLAEMMPKIIAESALQCIVIGALCKLGALTVITLIFARTAFCFVLTGSAMLTARFFREREKNNVFAAVCVFLGVIFSLPSVLVFVFLSGFGMGMIISFAAMSAVNILTGFVLLFFARNLLSFAD